MLPAFLRHSLYPLAAMGLTACGGPAPAQGAAALPPTAEAPAAKPSIAPKPDTDPVHVADARGAGAPHVHGLADLAITREGSTVMAELISPMANFGLSESDAEFSATVTAALPGLFRLSGGGCEASKPHPMASEGEGHTDAVVHVVWTCARPGEAASVRFTGFAVFPGFETVRAIYITPDKQTAADLTPSSPDLPLK